MRLKFRNRTEAGELLADRLASYRATRPVVLGVPRGAVPMARIIADRLDADLDVVLVHKLRAPMQPELAIGSVDELGQVYLTDLAAEEIVGREYLDAERREQLESLAARRRLYTPFHNPIDPAGRIVILVDDGIATGATMIAAIRSVRARHAAKVVVATPVAPPDTVEHLEHEADEVVCLVMPMPFWAIGQFYEDFDQVSDEEVVAALQGVPAPRAALVGAGKAGAS